MARPIEFDRNHVLKQAIRVFWLKGYHAASIKNLTDATGLLPGSLYAAFGDKRGLFLAALDAYFDAMKHTMVAALHEDKPPDLRLALFFDRLVSESCDDPDRKGCLLINTLSEIPIQDAEINSRLQRMFDEIERELKTVLTECREQGLMNEQLDPGTIAKFLMTGIFGLRLYNKTQPDAAILGSVVDRLLAAALGAPGSARQ
ncbi:MAG: TetR/AcrR family transcriptional regulator [Gammaproteobacteria bacterium]